VRSAIRSQHFPERSILSCISCLKQLHVKRGQVIVDVFEPGGVRSPGGLLQSSSRGSNSIRFAFAAPSIRAAICPYSEIHLLLTMEVSGGGSVMGRISSFLTKSRHWMLRICQMHHWPSAWICIITCLIRIQNGAAFWCRITWVVAEKRPFSGSLLVKVYIHCSCMLPQGADPSCEEWRANSIPTGRQQDGLGRATSGPGHRCTDSSQPVERSVCGDLSQDTCQCW